MTPSIHQYLPQHADQLMKLAKGKHEKYMPWYGAAAGATGAHEGVKALTKKLPKKLSIPLSIGGAVLGTAIGVHGGEALGKKLDKRKKEKEKAAEEKPKSRVKEVAKTVGKGVAGMALGSAAGLGTGKLIEYGARRMGAVIPKSSLVRYGLPIAGAGLGTAYSLWKAREQQELKSALEDTQDSGK